MDPCPLNHFDTVQKGLKKDFTFANGFYESNMLDSLDNASLSSNLSTYIT